MLRTTCSTAHFLETIRQPPARRAVWIAGLLCVVLSACGRHMDVTFVPCRHCAAPLSPTAKACPKCGEPTPIADLVVNSIGMRLKPVAAGRFRMGAADADTAARADEKPVHTVDISEPLLIGVTEVTQSQFWTVMDSNPSAFSPDGRKHAEVAGLDTGDFPVESVTWDEAVEFCDRLGRLPGERSRGRTYRLPTEAEWEFAATRATTPRAAAGTTITSPRPYAVDTGIMDDSGLIAMCGNVAEWTSDWFSSEYYLSSTGRNPKGANEGTVKSFRGAAWNTPPRESRITARDADVPDARRDDVGFRVVCIVEPDANAVPTARLRIPSEVVQRPAATPPASPRVTADISVALAAWKRAVVRIAVRTPEGDGQGSGFLIDSHGTVVTNLHVVEDALEVTAFFSDGFQERIREATGVIPDKDLAFVRLASGTSRCEPLSLSESLPPEGRSVFAVGCPMGLGFSLTQGIVSGIRSASELREAFRSDGVVGPDLSVQWIQTTAAINWGNSGGPLIDDRGRVVGVNTLVFGRSREDGVAEGLNFAVSSQDVLQARRSIAGGPRTFPLRK